MCCRNTGDAFARFEYHCAIGTAFPLRGSTRRLKTAFRAARRRKEITHMKSCRSDRRLCWIKCLICCTATDSDSVLRAARWPTFRTRAFMGALHVDHGWSLSSSSSHGESERQGKREGQLRGGKKVRDERRTRRRRKNGKTHNRSLWDI